MTRCRTGGQGTVRIGLASPMAGRLGRTTPYRAKKLILFGAKRDAGARRRVCCSQPPRPGLDYQVSQSGVASSQATSCPLVGHVVHPCRGEALAAPVQCFAAGKPAACAPETLQRRIAYLLNRFTKFRVRWMPGHPQSPHCGFPSLWRFTSPPNRQRRPQAADSSPARRMIVRHNSFNEYAHLRPTTAIALHPTEPADVGVDHPRTGDPRTAG